MSTRLILFDIDGTLVLTGGAGLRAFDRAMAVEFDSGMSLEIISPAGMTDTAIFQTIFEQNRKRPPTAGEEERLYARYLEYLEEEVERSPDFQVLAGVRELVEELSAHDGFHLGLGTGNLEGGARIKMKRAGLDGYFPFGGFGSDSSDRSELLGIAVERGKRGLAADDGVEAVFVVGDTPRDIEAGKAIGARILAVASGSYDMNALAAADADLVVEDLCDRERLMEWFSS
jgi:phosphoglycolate phosphatase-like HAD superfamily hydrolase